MSIKDGEDQLPIVNLFEKVRKNGLHSLEARKLNQALGESDETDITVLLSYLMDDNSDLRRYAVYGLGFTRDKRAFEPLLEILLGEEKDKDKALYYFTVQSLGNLDYPDRRAISPLLEALKNKDSDIRIIAAQVLGAFDDERVIQSLKEVFTTDIPRVSEAAKGSYGYIMMNRYKRR